MELRVKQLYKEYPTPGAPLVVLDGLDLTLEAGDSLAVTGPSGCGKSTLLYILGTLDEPTRGAVEMDSVNPFALSARELARFRNCEIGFVFQDHHLLPQCTVLENVLVPTLVATSPDSQRETWALELLERVGLSDRRHHRPGELSGGERQRAAIARALINRPSLVLCDEPTGNLDLATANRVGDLFVELHAEFRNILIVVTHSLELAGRFGRRVDLQDGRLSESR